MSLLLVGTHPHHAAKEPNVTADDLYRRGQAPESGRDRRGRARLSLRQQSARRPGKGISHPHSGGARNQASAGDPRPRGGRRYRPHSRRGKQARRIPLRAALLHRRRGARAPRCRARRLRLVLGHSHLQERRELAEDRRPPARGSHSGRDRRAVSRAQSLSRQTERARLCRRDRARTRRDARRQLRCHRENHQRQFLPPLFQGSPLPDAI